jgi:dTDP-4-amino-4,6-dideoxygalactose transaminase
MQWKIPLYKIYTDEDGKKAVGNVIGRGSYWTNGPENLQLEEELSSYLGQKYAISFVNGTAALHSMLLAYGIGHGDEVIVPSFTFISTANSVLFTGAKPVFSDIEKQTYALDPDDVRKRITEKTKAILPIHYGGCPALPIKELAEIAEEKGLLLLEDNAESLGSELGGIKTGTFGDSSILSFCANKVITGGEGGAVITDSQETFEKLKLLRSHGREENGNYFESHKSMDYVSLGFNYRMPTIVAALILSQLRKIDKIIAMRREAAKHYDDLLSGLELTVPPDRDGLFNVYQMYTVRLDSSKREKLRELLKKNGVMTKVYFDPVHETHFYKRILGYNDSLPNTSVVSKEVLTLPLFPGITAEETEYICDIIKKFLK